MFEKDLNGKQSDERQSVTLRDLLNVGFRQKRLMINTFLGIFSLALLDAFASLYLEMLLAIHRAPGEFEFFQQQAEQYRNALINAETKLTNFSRDQGVVNPTLEKELTVRTLAHV